MSETTGPEATPDPTPATEPLQLADQSPLEPVATTPAARQSHTRTILEVVGGVVAVGLILVAAAAGFGLGRITSDGDGGHDRGQNLAQGFDRGQRDLQGQGMPGLPDQQGQGMPGQQGQGMPGLPGQQGQGMDPRGIDPDGDNWTGGGHQDRGPQDTLPTTPMTPTTPATPSGL